MMGWVEIGFYWKKRSMVKNFFVSFGKRSLCKDFGMRILCGKFYGLGKVAGNIEGNEWLWIVLKYLTWFTRLWLELAISEVYLYS